MVTDNRTPGVSNPPAFLLVETVDLVEAAMAAVHNPTDFQRACWTERFQRA
jgi:hypothetical protein